jgi:hypothetical protein
MVLVFQAVSMAVKVWCHGNRSEIEGGVRGCGMMKQAGSLGHLSERWPE